MATRGERNRHDAPIVDLRGPSRLVALRAGRLPGAGPSAGRPPRPDRVHPRRAPAGHGAPVLRLVGLPDDRLLRADGALRNAPGPDVPGRPAAPAGLRRHPRLGAVALPDRRPRPGAVRRHAPVRARRPAPRVPPRLEERDLQLRPPRGPQLPASRAPGSGSSATTPTGCGSTPWRRCSTATTPATEGEWIPNEYGGNENLGAITLPPGAQPAGLRPSPRRDDHRRGVDGLARRLPAHRRRRTRLRLQVGHGLDERHAATTSHAGPGPPPLPPRRAHLPHGVRLQRELRPAAVARRGRARQGLAAGSSARRSLAAVGRPASRCTATSTGSPGKKLLFMGGPSSPCTGEWQHEQELPWGLLAEPANSGVSIGSAG